MAGSFDPPSSTDMLTYIRPLDKDVWSRGDAFLELSFFLTRLMAISSPADRHARMASVVDSDGALRFVTGMAKAKGQLLATGKTYRVRVDWGRMRILFVRAMHNPPALGIRLPELLGESQLGEDLERA